MSEVSLSQLFAQTSITLNRILILLQKSTIIFSLFSTASKKQCCARCKYYFILYSCRPLLQASFSPFFSTYQGFVAPMGTLLLPCPVCVLTVHPVCVFVHGPPISYKQCCCWCSQISVFYISNTHTYTHPFNGPLSGTTQVSRYQKGKTNLDFTEARDSEWQWHQVGHM